MALILAKLTGEEETAVLGTWEYKEKIKKALLIKNLIEDKTVVLLIDEGQKLSRQGIELLRELLNFETNTCKLLQLVIFAQPEFKRHLDAMYNFTDRINFLYELTRFNFEECKKMITSRLGLCSKHGNAKKLFTTEAIKKIHIASKGRPRQIITLCHKLLLQLFVKKQKKVTGRMVDSYLNKKSGISVLTKYVLAFLSFMLLTFWVARQLTIAPKNNLDPTEQKRATESRWEIKRDSVIKIY